MFNTDHNNLITILSTSSEIWKRNKNHSLEKNIKSLEYFINDILKKNDTIKKTMNYSYNTYYSTPFHFLLYYLSLPNPVFFTYINSSLFYGVFIGRKYKIIHLCCPIYSSKDLLLSDIIELLNKEVICKIVKQFNIKSIVLRDFDVELIKSLKKSKEKLPFQVTSLKEIPYAIYDLENTLSLKGKKFANIRWHLNKFKKENHQIEIIEHIKNEKPLIHLIGKWRSNAINDRGFSFIDVRSDKFGSKLIRILQHLNNTSNSKEMNFIHFDNCYFRVLKIDNQISSFHLGYPIGFLQKSNLFAHAIGITDLNIPHLAEYAQIEFWKYIHSRGFRFVNDGPSWRKSLEIFKIKFRPIQIQKYYWVSLSLN